MLDFLAPGPPKNIEKPRRYLTFKELKKELFLEITVWLRGACCPARNNPENVPHTYRTITSFAPVKNWFPDRSISPRQARIRTRTIFVFGKNVMKKLHKKIIESQVKTLYLALDNDAKSDAIKISDTFVNEGIDVKLVMLKDKDPSEIGFEGLLSYLKDTESTNFSRLLKYKLRGFS